MTDDHPEPPKADDVRQEGNLVPLNQPQPSNPPVMPNSVPDDTNGMRASDATLLERHQTALHHIHTLDAHNAKLYEDNCRLVNTVNMLNDRLAFSGAPKNVQVLHLSDMQEKLRASEENRTSIYQKYQQLLHSISASPSSVHHHIYMELQTIRDSYTSLDREYRLLGEKYVRLKAIVDTCRVTQQQSVSASHVARALVPVVRSEFRARDHSSDNSPPSTSVTSPGSSLGQKENHRRRSSESIVAQPSLRSGPPSLPVAWLTPLPTPPPSASLPGGQILPTIFPVHSPPHSRPLVLLHHASTTQDLRILSGLPSVTSSQHFVEKDASEQRKVADHVRQRCELEETVNMDNNKPAPCSKQISTSAPLQSSPRPPKRPNLEPQTSRSPEGERKKPRTEAENTQSEPINADTCPTNEISSLLASPGPHNDHNLSESGLDVRSYQDCVNLIFEKDAEVENGVFCGLCFDRHEAKMIPEPPDVLIQPDFDFLVKHCMAMHPAVWDDLRRKA